MPSKPIRDAIAEAGPVANTARLSLSGPADHDAVAFGQFADAMAGLAASVCVATAAQGGEREGRTVTAVTSLSATPPSLLVSITKGSALADLIVRTGRFSLSMLAVGQDDVGDAFAGKLAPEDRFGVGSWGLWPSGQPKLNGAATAIDLKLTGTIALDTHCLFLGVLVATHTTQAEPLVWHQRSYRELAPKD